LVSYQSAASKLCCSFFLSLILLDRPIESLLDALAASFEIDITKFRDSALPRPGARAVMLDLFL
jgi:hypothetical protein